jgi:hypothetical protein
MLIYYLYYLFIYTYGCVFLMLTTLASEVVRINCCHVQVVLRSAMGRAKGSPEWIMGDTLPFD